MALLEVRACKDYGKQKNLREVGPVLNPGVGTPQLQSDMDLI